MEPLEKQTIVLEAICIEDVKHDIEQINNEDDFASVIEYARRNGLYYSTISKLISVGISPSYINDSRWDDELSNLEKSEITVKFIKNICEQESVDFRVIKLFDTVPHVPNDIDLFVRPSDRVSLLNVLKQNQMEFLESSIAETKLIGKYKKTDIYTKIKYVGLEYVDEELILNSTRTADFQGIEYPALDYEVDLLMLIPHHILGHRRITLLDFIHLRKLLEESDLDFCRRYAYDHGWGYLFDAALVRLGRIDNTIFRDGGHVEFPHTFERGFVYDCIRGSSGHDLGYRDIPVLYMSFLIHDLIYAFEGTYIYDFVKSSDPLRNAVNWFSTVLKSRRGDKTSPSE